jgi:hypothetical protein
MNAMKTEAKQTQNGFVSGLLRPSRCKHRDLEAIINSMQKPTLIKVGKNPP